MNVTGESFDYGPYRFLPTFDPSFVAAYFDHSGLYAFGRQPTMLAWNLEQLVQALIVVCEPEPLNDTLRKYRPAFERVFRGKCLERLGLTPREPELDQPLTTTFTHSCQTAKWATSGSSSIGMVDS